ncbi:unnamed protein product [Victoria cruziana]
MSQKVYFLQHGGKGKK